MVSWKSRCSGVRLVKTATSNQVLSTRCSVRAWDDTSRATACVPRSTAAARAAWRCGASGVVRAPERVPITSAGRPSARRTAPSRWVVVVLPLVPVTPTTDNRRDGWSKKAAAAGARAARESVTSTWGTSAPGPAAGRSTSSSTTRATAPAATARAAKRCPSKRDPRTQKNSAPGTTASESEVTATTSMPAGSPRTLSTFTSPSSLSSRTVQALGGEATTLPASPVAAAAPAAGDERRGASSFGCGGIENSLVPASATRAKIGAETMPA